MRDRIDPLIQERANWLFEDRIAARLARPLLDRLLSYDATVALATKMADLPSEQIMDHVGRLLAKKVEVTGLDNLPASGAALIVANHPTGIADGIVLHRILATRRSDTYFFANQDILRVLPQMEDMIAPVEWRLEKRSHAKTRATMAYTRKAVEAGRLGVIFPSGRLAKRRGFRLYERPWMSSSVTIARKFDLPVIPIRMEARNSALFYLFDAIHPTLRDITLFHETLNKADQRFRIHVGAPIAAADIPARPEHGIAMLRDACLSLAGGQSDYERALPLVRKPAFP
ncbi:1-acyl-sn-glycerol-3-phosphate acyltransferase [Marinovum sp. 2_MG-2023]|uniref:1-acyl-sn-glycerol-3-phosphate acyltransferase n=1 Tax=unclassified Marinovum TaxID=2647166 RepID=UPI0026E3FA1F|nr:MULTISPECIES: 1-acyl-sn-glycerol-3-phosphate acyltransferase [unclassified Marinovum]MDO6731430.1 1-acyl-sn-glycerol-3-phosphate acyltransferase [Marinovum sp. 2_MG-2023]MDO6780671.1 1-acyl-sn-glycerol-3-phosphate acyltransferase [Marinovum sp. 1_MG-2023]